MARKNHFYCAFLPCLWSPASSPPWLFTLWGHKTGSRSYATYIFSHDIAPFLRLLPYD
jgi:hypothetical protein